MSDLLNAPMSDLLKVLERYLRAVKDNNMSELNDIMQNHAEIFTDEFQEHIRGWLNAFGITPEFIQALLEKRQPKELEKVASNTILH